MGGYPRISRTMPLSETSFDTELASEEPTSEPVPAFVVPASEPAPEPASVEPASEPATTEPVEPASEPATTEPVEPASEPATTEPEQEPATTEPEQEPATTEPVEPPTTEPEQEPEPPPEPEPTERPTHYYVLSDSQGYIGTFYSAKTAKEIVQKYSPVPFIIQRFGVASGPVATVWIVLYRDIDSVAFVSNSRAEAERVQGIYNNVGLAYPDSIDYWEHSANRCTRSALDRLETLREVHSTVFDPEEMRIRQEENEIRLERLERQRDDGPLARMIRENEPITIYDCVVPWVPDGAADDDGAAVVPPLFTDAPDNIDASEEAPDFAEP